MIIRLFIVLVWNAVAVLALGETFNIYHPLFGVLGIWVLALNFIPFIFVEDRIHGFLVQIFGLDELVDGFRQLALIGRELIYGPPHLPEIFMQDSFARVLNAPLVGRNSNREKDDHDKHRDHQFEQRKASLSSAITSHYTSPH